MRHAIIRLSLNYESHAMDSPNAVAALAALAHESRLAAFRLLVQAGPEGLAASRIAEALGIPASSLSFHLKVQWSNNAGHLDRWIMHLQRSFDDKATPQF